MDESLKDQSSGSANPGRSSSKLLRYPLRSATKSREHKTPLPDSANSSASKRGRELISSVSKSMSVLDISGKDKSAKPARRLSIPVKSTTNSARKPVGSITPISEAREKRSINSVGKSDTPASDASRSSFRRKFSILSSASYWIAQIKLSESAAKHSISLGFFKLALEAGCEPLQRMRDELKSYVRRHNVVELGDSLKELLESYSISESLEQLQVSETCPQMPEEGTQSFDDDVNSSSSITGTQKLKPKSLNTNPVISIRASANKISAKPTYASEGGARKTQQKFQKPSKLEMNKVDSKIKKSGQKPALEEGLTNPSLVEEAREENKENMDAPQMEEISSIEV